ncbi:FAD-dependent oxidoreductase [Azohydromonas caseinilytica]|uniref:FAD-dependent oxidoreductase n=1 Tax=Azohydromonas caseinilytica TaxID=2728836 RepID=A0A848FIG1_9BURK|nr:FAD-dependent oxidoreductase [Azohydromonas caseinilytica]NML17990.1 FAD-dependent oxidoreductase [Azohydromonas caseinilytica]
MLLNLSDLPPGGDGFDVVVIGAGAAGMSAALCAALDGARVLLVERTEFVGGTSALSGGTTWVPGTGHSAAVNPGDTLQDAQTYLDAAIGERAPRTLRQALLRSGPEAVAHVERHSAVKFRPYPTHPDYISELPGSTLRGRALEPLPFDGRLLGQHFSLLRPPIPEFTVLGGMMVDRNDIPHLLAMKKSFRSLRYSLRILARHAMDRLKHPRGTRLLMGNALCGRLLYSLLRQPKVKLAMRAEVAAFRRENGAIAAVTVKQGGQRRELRVSGGVVLASGGFNRHPGLRAQLLGTDEVWCPGAPGHTGQAHELLRELGARYGEGALSPAFWAPVSLRRRADGSRAVFPHFLMDRAKPGMITVDARGRRFLNESTSYHLFGIGMQQAGAVPAYLIADARALKKYGMGMVRPGGQGLEPYLADGYLTQGATLQELAVKLGIDPDGLRASVARINDYAQTGVDEDFQRGSTDYSRNMGDATLGLRNPNLGPLTEAPFYAVRLYPGDIGAAQGWATDEQARVLDAQQQPIAGLYAVGNDMHSAFGGVYAAPGITLGPGLVFGYLAGRHAARRAQGGANAAEPQHPQAMALAA